jgi:hypothetical protein
LAWDLIVFLALGILCERRNRRGFLQCITISGLTIIGAVAIWCPNITVYRGLSGIDSALFGWLLADVASHAFARRNRRAALLTGAMAAIFVAKTAIERLTESTIFVAVESTFVPVPVAHVAGFVAGALTAWLDARHFRLTPASSAWLNRAPTQRHDRASHKLLTATCAGRRCPGSRATD